MQQGVIGEAVSTADRRHSGTDRRTNLRKAAVHSVYRNRRKHLRRESDHNAAVYVDAHEPVLFYLAVTLMTLSVLDAFFTTILLQHGSEELNPLLALLLEIDLYIFLAAKFCVTGFGILFLIMHKRHRLFDRVSCYQLLIACVAIYIGLVAYEINMIRHLPLF